MGFPFQKSSTNWRKSSTKDAGALAKKFSHLRQEAVHQISDETEEKKKEYLAEATVKKTSIGNIHYLPNFPGWRISLRKNSKISIKNWKRNSRPNKVKRLEIIEKLKNFIPTPPPTPTSSARSEKIKEEWASAGQVAKNEFRILNNNYFHHLNQFYSLLDLNKEYLEQEYEHNLEKRKQIIARAKEL